MKHVFLIAVALIIALLITDYFVSSIIGYPKNVPGSRVFKVSDRLTGYNYITWKPPYYAKWSVEGGNKVIHFNNVGLYGVDIKNSESNKYIVLLGNSYVEGAQFQGDQIAAGILQLNLSKQRKDEYQVINLGSSAHDPYILWYRLMFFKNYFNPSIVVLIYESYSTLTHYYLRWGESDLEYSNKVYPVQMHQRKLKRSIDYLCGLSAYINLCYSLREKKVTERRKEHGVVQITDNYLTYRRLTESLIAYKDAFGDRFLFVSLMNDNPFKEELAEFCSTNRIAYAFNSTIMDPVNLIHGAGHLNKRGNRMLGNVLFNELVRKGMIN